MFIIGIAGGSGSGKTTVVNKLIGRLESKSVAVISQDAYYYDAAHLPLEERRKINFDHPDSIEFSLLTQHIEKLRQGQSAEIPTYSFVSCTRQEQTEAIEPCNVLIVEGIFVLAMAEVRKYFDLKVFVDADDDDRLARRILRDIAERGRTAESVISDYTNKVKPMHLQFIEPSKRFADIIVPQGGHNERAIDILHQYIANFANETDK